MTTKKAIYVLQSNCGQYLYSTMTSGGSIIFQYTSNFHDAMIMDKQTAEYYCDMKDFFIKLKLAS